MVKKEYIKVYKKILTDNHLGDAQAGVEAFVRRLEEMYASEKYKEHNIYTPYPKWCWIFSIASGIVIVLITRLFGNNPFANALGTGWISLGSIWTYAGLLITMRRTD